MFINFLKVLRILKGDEKKFKLKHIKIIFVSCAFAKEGIWRLNLIRPSINQSITKSLTSAISSKELILKSSYYILVYMIPVRKRCDTMQWP